MDPIKDAFQKVRQEIDLLKQETIYLKNSLIETREKLVELAEIMLKINGKASPTHEEKNLTIPTHNPTHPTHFKPLNSQNLGISIGNQGVPTDKPTDKPTHQQIEILPEKKDKTIDNAVEILESLDNIKKEIRLKFKRLTDQEMTVFSTIYQFDEERGYSDHKMLAQRLNLSESSIRDYVGRIIKKGIPIDKKRVNNKQIQINISKNLKKIASLHTILQLREL